MEKRIRYKTKLIGEKIPLSFLLPMIVNQAGKKDPINKIELQGQLVYIQSQRLFTFKEKGCSCISCKREGTHFRIQENGNGIHFGLWSDDNVEMTKDHIIPKSLGGYNHIDNYQTMCSKCNSKKGNTFSKKDFVKGKGKLDFDEATVKRKEIRKKNVDECSIYTIVSENFKDISDVRLRLGMLRRETLRDPFQNRESVDVIYALQYLDGMITESKAKISTKSLKINFIPKKLIKASKERFNSQIDG